MWHDPGSRSLHFLARRNFEGSGIKHGDFCGFKRMIAGFSGCNEVNGAVGFLLLVQWVAGQMIEFGLRISFLLCQNNHFVVGLQIYKIRKSRGIVFGAPAVSRW